MVRRTLTAVAFASFLLSRTTPAHARPVPDVVYVVIRDCASGEPTPSESYSAVVLELQLLGVERVLVRRSPEPTDAELSIEMGCDQKLEAMVALTVTATSITKVLRVPLVDVRREDRPRALALVVAEFVRLKWTPLTVATAAPTTTPEALAPADRKPRDTPLTNPDEGSRRSISLQAAGRTRWFADYRSVAWGGARGLPSGVLGCTQRSSLRGVPHR